jgi:hypothetical protein
VIDSRVRGRRSGAILAAALFIIAAMPGLVTAANSRMLFIGSPDAQTNDGKLLPTTVSKPGPGAPDNATKFVVQIKSTDNQNIAHTVLTIDADKQHAAGLSLETFYDPNPAGQDDASPDFCGRSGDVITCNYSNFSAGTRTIAVIVDVTSDYVAPALQPLFWAKVTTNNENGSNQQLFIAASGPVVGDDTPPAPFNVSAFDANLLTSFAPPGQAKHLFTSAPSGDNKLSTTIDFTAHGTGDTVAITEGTSTDTTYKCPTFLSCETTYSEVITSTETFGTPYFKWTLTALVPKNYTLSQGFVVHYPKGAQTYNPVNDQYWILYFKDKTSFCGALEITSNGHCISSLNLTKPVNGFSTLTITFVTNHQGGAKY